MRHFILLALAGLSTIFLPPRSFAGEELVVHEWGTFTSLQDETGRAIGGINDDVEALPDFVFSMLPAEGGPKGFPVNPDVTMRLETPVVYFYPPAGAALPMTLAFSAEFRGGWLTQFYPEAKTNFAGLGVPKIDEATIGSLTWDAVRVGTGAPGPATTSHVWLAPRKVGAADLTVGNGQSERYLFYRGVGKLDSPLEVARTGGTLHIGGQIGLAPAWYLDAREDGKLAFRKLDLTGSPTRSGTVTEAAFEAANYRTDSIDELRRQLQAALVEAGLFEDEAAAMLETWRDSYFKTPGARVLFIVPNDWVNGVLPIRVSVPAKVTRVIVGRVDLVTPAQRAMVSQIVARGSRPEDPEVRRLHRSLGRFAGAILRDTARRSGPAELERVANLPR